MTKIEFDKEWVDHVKRIDHPSVTINSPEVELERALNWDSFKNISADEFRKVCNKVEGRFKLRVI